MRMEYIKTLFSVLSYALFSRGTSARSRGFSMSIKSVEYRPLLLALVETYVVLYVLRGKNRIHKIIQKLFLLYTFLISPIVMVKIL
jgi:hypothetical protein